MGGVGWGECLGNCVHRLLGHLDSCIYGYCYIKNGPTSAPQCVLYGFKGETGGYKI